MEDYVILVDENDNELGVEEKLKAHIDGGKLHRSFSIFVFNDSTRLMLQKRSYDKYHSGGLWSNTTCSHPRPGEIVIEAANRRLQEEMGFDCELKEEFKFIYKASLDNGYTEHEIDHVLIGAYSGDPLINKEEVSDWKWADVAWLCKDIELNPHNYTYWLKIALEKINERDMLEGKSV